MIKRIADHVGSNYDEDGDIRRFIEELNIPTHDISSLKESPTKMEDKIWDTEYKAYMQQTTLLRRNTEKLLSLILWKCTPAMKSKLESRDDWTVIKSGYIIVDLLNDLRDVAYKFEVRKNPCVSIHTVNRDTFIIK